MYNLSLFEGSERRVRRSGNYMISRVSPHEMPDVAHYLRGSLRGSCLGMVAK